MNPSSPATLVAVLTEAQRLGMLGDRPVPEVVEHAQAFVDALEGVDGRVVDLGSGGGVPGLVIAAARVDLEVVLVDRRERRADFLRRAVSRLGYGDRVVVRCVDAVRMGGAEPASFDAVVARGFGPPETTLRVAVPLVRGRGPVVISEPPGEEPDRWSASLLQELGVSRTRRGAVSVFTRPG